MRKYLSYFFSVTGPYRWALTLSVLCSIVLAVCSFFYVYFSKALVDVATHQASGHLAYLGAAFAGIILLRIGSRALRTWMQSKSVFQMKNALRQRQFDALLQMTAPSREKLHSGDIINRLEGDVDAVSNAACLTIPNLIGTGLQFCVAFGYLVWLDARLAWILLLVIPLGIIAARFVLRKMRMMSKDVREGDSRVQSHMQESLQHQTLIKALEYDGQSSMNLTTLQSDVYKNSLRRTRFGIAAHVISALCFSVSYALAFLWGVYGIAAGTVTYGMMTAFLQLVNQVQRPLAEMGDQLPGLFHSTASVDRLLELDAMEKEPLCEPRMLEGVAGIRVENLCFTYPGAQEAVFTDFSYGFAPGSKTAIVGTTGVGKTTLIKLMLSLQQPSSGSLSFYSEGGERVPASAATRCNLIYVPQGNSLISGTVRDNLRMGDPFADEEKLRSVLHTAAADFVLSLPGGMDTPCFEAGGGLSEGQAQRIAIARGLLRPGSILLLDEFSSALDEATEKTLLERLVAEYPDKTMIFITHRGIVTQYCEHTLKLS
ncbi:MAG: ABC transporter ATP-binding protein [Bacteroidales bacterium]|nr:ABC transporter ATP-binding protein [Bacteroidales bacterium]